MEKKAPKNITTTWKQNNQCWAVYFLNTDAQAKGFGFEYDFLFKHQKEKIFDAVQSFSFSKALLVTT